MSGDREIPSSVPGLVFFEREPTPPDEVKPLRAPSPTWERFSVTVSKPPGCTAWRASVFVALDPTQAPEGLEESFGTKQEAWDRILQFVEARIGRGVP